MIFLIGGKGLVGSAFKRYFIKKKIIYKLITKNNKKKFFNKKCSLLIDCNGNSSKKKAILDPFYDFKASVLPVLENLNKINFEKYIYFSSIQVYKNFNEKKFTKENCNYNLENNTYGFNKKISEMYIQKYSKKFLIFRLTYVIGPGIKSNPFYDITKTKKIYCSLDSNINFIHADSIAKLVMKLSKKNNEIYNLGSKNNLAISKILALSKFKRKELKIIKKKKILTNINLDKISKIIKLPNSFNEAKKFFKEKN
jgi:dTDP-4-dehydrorhamnose reductase